MKTWIGLILAILGLVLGLGSTLLDGTIVHSTEYANLAEYSPTLVGLAILMMIASFLLIFSNRRDGINY